MLGAPPKRTVNGACTHDGFDHPGQGWVLWWLVLITAKLGQMAIVEEHLRAAAAILGSGADVDIPASVAPAAPPVVPAAWEGSTRALAAARSSFLHGTHEQLAAVQARLTAAITAAEAAGRSARIQLSEVQSEWRDQQAALRAQAGTAEGAAAFLTAGASRVNEASQIVAAAAGSYGQSTGKVRDATSDLPFPYLPEFHIDPTPPPPPRRSAPVCYIGTEDGDVVKLCPPDTDTVTYFDRDGNYVSKDLGTGAVTIMHSPGPQDDAPTDCWLPSADADRSICGPRTTTWTYPRDGYLITEQLGPDGKTHITFRTPRGPLIP